MNRRQWLATLTGLVLSPSLSLVPTKSRIFWATKEIEFIGPKPKTTRVGYYGWAEQGFAIIDSSRFNSGPPPL
jgi:hypothetical protein